MPYSKQKLKKLAKLQNNPAPHQLGSIFFCTEPQKKRHTGTSQQHTETARNVMLAHADMVMRNCCMMND
jgi:hypothetical protein